jgi:predicted ATPase
MVASVAVFEAEMDLLGQVIAGLSAIANEHGLIMAHVQADLYAGWRLVTEGDPEAGVVKIMQAQSMTTGGGSEFFKDYNSCLMVRTLMALGRIEDALNAVNDAQLWGQDRGIWWFHAELLRLRAEVLLMQDAEHEVVERELQEALAVARQQKAKSWELRAATSLARLWLSQGKNQEARDLLVPVYDWFTEGFDTPDLKNAKALLEELVK